MRVSQALTQALARVDQENWRSRLDELHGRAGSWRALAGQLGAQRRTVERWRYGYTDKRGNRRQVSDKTIKDSAVPKIREAWKGDRAAQVGAVNWRNLQILGTLVLLDYEERARRENMSIGRYLSPESIAAISAAYISGTAADVTSAVNQAVSVDYVGMAAQIRDVEKLEF